jgi:hypothetical protein
VRASVDANWSATGLQYWRTCVAVGSAKSLHADRYGGELGLGGRLLHQGARYHRVVQQRLQGRIGEV